MPREFPRSRRVGEEIRRIVSEALRRDFQDPRLEFVSVTAVDVSGDLSQARVFFSSLKGQDAASDAAKALRSSTGRLRRLLARQLKLRVVPELRFEYDDSLDRGARISALLAGEASPDDESA